MKYVLDTNCIIDLEDDRRENHRHMEKILSEWSDGEIELAVVAVSASEKQKDGDYSETFKDFENKLSNAGLQGVDILLPMAYYDISYMDHALYCDEKMTGLKEKIHNILSPDTPLECPKGDERKITDWRNKKCDVQIAWALIYHKWEILITSDGNFLRKSIELGYLGVKKILPPCNVAKNLTSWPE